MAVVATRNQASETSTNTELSVTYTVKDSGESSLDFTTAVAAAAAQAVLDYGIEIQSASHRRITDYQVEVPVVISKVQYYDYIAQIGGIGGSSPYTAKITEDRVARILPPQPFEIDTALEIIQKQPTSANGDEITLDDQLILQQTVDGTRQSLPIYPPQENFSSRFTVPPALMTVGLFKDVSRLAHTLNDAPILLGGAEWPAQTVMLLAGLMQAPQGGAGVLELSFAVGFEYDKDWTRHKTPGGDTEAETLEGVKPFSVLTFYKKRIAATESAPASVELYGVWEHRVWPKSDYSTVFATPSP